MLCKMGCPVFLNNIMPPCLSVLSDLLVYLTYIPSLSIPTDVFFKFRDCILTHAPNCGQKLRNDLCRGIPRVWLNYFILDLEKDIAFEIGRFYYGIKDYANALYYYQQSSATVGNHHVTYHNQGLCFYSLNQLEVRCVMCDVFYCIMVLV